MNQTISKPYEWLKKIPASVLKMDDIPLLGHPPKFPWDALTDSIAQTFEVKSLKIEPSALQWRTESNLFEGLGTPLMPITLAVGPLEGKMFWTMTSDNVKNLMSQLIAENLTPLEILDDEEEEDYLNPFYKFLALEVIHAIEVLEYDPSLSIQLIQPAELPSCPMLSLDIAIHINNHQAVARLFFSPEMTQSAKEYYIKKGENALFTPPLSEQTNIVVHLEAGQTTLPFKIWSEIKKGDFLLLDKCSLKPGDSKGRVMITIKGHPLFRGKITDGNLKILEHPLYYEENQIMNKEEHDEDEDEFEDEESEFEDEDEDEDEESEFDDEESELEGEYNEDESEIEDEESEIEDEESENGEDEESSTDQVSSQSAPLKKGIQEVKEALLSPTKAQLVSKKKDKITSPQDIPVSVIVEVGRVQMTVQTLMELTPGNILDLDLHPESSVDLIVNGSRVGKGELLQIGEHLGVRILELG